MMFTRLLIPLDGSPLAEQAIGQATAIARASSAEMDLVLVHQPFPFDGFGKEPWIAALWAEERKYLESVAAQISAGTKVGVTYETLRGDPVDMICRRIGDVRADLVVMTSHGRTGLSRMWLGSVADGVLRYSTIPVLMLRPIEGRARQDAAQRPFKRVLVPVDGSTLSEEALPAATALAKCSDASISLLRVVQPVALTSAEPPVPFSYAPVFVDEPATTRLAQEVREQLAEDARRLQQESGIEVDAQVVVEPRVAQAILEVARTHDIDVVAMSTHGRGMSRFLLGSIADKVLRGSGLPMLLYRPLGARAKAEVLETRTEAPAPELTHA